MKSRPASRLISICSCLLAVSACSGLEPSGREKCTRGLLDDTLGGDAITVTLMIPDHYMSGAEISNGGIHAFDGNCDFPVNMFLSFETASKIIADARKLSISEPRTGMKLAEAELFIWQFEDGSNQTRFFVTSVGSFSDPSAVPEWAKGHFIRSGGSESSEFAEH